MHFQAYMNNTRSLEGSPVYGPKILLVSIVDTFGIKFCLHMHLEVESKARITLGFGPKKPRVQNTSSMDLAFELNSGSQTKSFL